MDMLTEMPIPLTVRLQECPSGKESRRKRATLSSDPLLFCNFNTNSSYTRDRVEGGVGGDLAPPLFCKNKNKLNKK